MVKTGLEAYRFSISWARLIPDGNGPVNPKGLQYYNNLINELIENGIQPHTTLYHLDTPQALEDEYNGWLSWKMVRDFIRYADICFKEFGDRVTHWTTINEANIFAIGGYDNGIAPPGRCSLPFGVSCTKGDSSTEPYIAGHNLLLAHSSVVQLYRKKYKAIQHGFVGLNLYTPWYAPNTNSTEDLMATQRTREFYTGWLLHPLVFGDYPDIVKKNVGTKLPVFTSEELNLVKGAFDFLGLNHYSTIYIKDDPISFNMKIRDLNADMGAKTLWSPDLAPSQENVDSSGLYKILHYLKTEYGNPPTYIHENGTPSIPFTYLHMLYHCQCRLPLHQHPISSRALKLLRITSGQAAPDPSPSRGRYQLILFGPRLTGMGTVRGKALDDELRVKYVQSYLRTLLDALRDGANTKGYFLWSFLDGFELLGGFKVAYGLYYVDLDDKELRRYPKLSAQWYSNFLKGRFEIQNSATSAFIASQ